MAMTEQAKEARKAYKREWARKNRDKVRTAQERYWNKLAAKKDIGVPLPDVAHEA